MWPLPKMLQEKIIIDFYDLGRCFSCTMDFFKNRGAATNSAIFLV